MEIPEAKAICQNCQEEIIGSITIKGSKTAGWSEKELIFRAEGGLCQLCVGHHLQRGVLGKEEGPQHNQFSILRGSKRLGRMEVASFTRSHRFEIENEEMLRELLSEIKKTHPERRT